MFCKKNDVKPKVKNISVKINDFSKGLNLDVDQNILDPNYCVSVYNFDYNKGVLKESFGLKNFECPNYVNNDLVAMEQQYDEDWVDLKNVWFFKMYDANNGGRVDKLLFYGSDKSIYFSRIITQIPLIGKYFEMTFSEKPTFSYNIKNDGVDYNLFGSENLGVYKFDGQLDPVKMNEFPNLNSMCEDKGMLFGSGYGERNVLYYHKNLDFTTWTDTTDDDNGKIVMNDDRGKINKVIPYLGYVFAIRDYGISKIINYDKEETPEVVHLNLSGSRIFENTVCISRDKILMLTKDGLCSFNGITNNVLDLSFNNMLKNVNNENAIGVFHSGKYYLACKLDFGDGNKVGCENLETFNNNALVILDVETNNFELIRGIDILSMCSVQLNSMDKIAIVLNNMQTKRVFELDNSGQFFDQSFVKEWISPLTDLGYSNKIKIVNDFSVLSKFDAQFTIFSEKESKTFKVLGGKILNKIKVNLKGRQIGIKIKSLTDKAYISNVNLNIGLMDYAIN